MLSFVWYLFHSPGGRVRSAKFNLPTTLLTVSQKLVKAVTFLFQFGGKSWIEWMYHNPSISLYEFRTLSLIQVKGNLIIKKNLLRKTFKLIQLEIVYHILWTVNSGVDFCQEPHITGQLCFLHVWLHCQGSCFHWGHLTTLIFFAFSPLGKNCVSSHFFNLNFSAFSPSRQNCASSHFFNCVFF